MPDDERTRRRLGDATKSNIAGLADGWSATPAPAPAPASEPADVSAASPPAVPAEPPARARAKTLPPPPPGSAERRALETQILDSKVSAPDLPAVVEPARPRKPLTMPPPIPPPRARPPTTQSPPLAVRVRVAADSEPIIPLDKPKVRALTSPFPAVAMSAARPSPAAASSPRVTRPTTPPALPAIPPPGQATYIDIVPLGENELRGDDGLSTAPQRAVDPASSPSGGAPDEGRAPSLEKLVAPDPIAPEALVNATGRLRAVPLGEFDDGAGTMDDGTLRRQHAHATMKRDAAEALLKMPPPLPPPRPEPPPTPEPAAEAALEIGASAASLRGDPTAVDNAAGDPTYERGDPTAVSGAQHEPRAASAYGGPAATLRAGAALRRKRGVGGDVRYVFTALFGVRRTRVELADLEIRQATRQGSRRRHLVTLGRTAMLSEYRHAAMDESRVSFESVEDERSGYAGQVAAADAEVDRVRRDREATTKKRQAELASIEVELGNLAKKLEPLDREAVAVQRRADSLREQLAKLDAQIASTQNSLITVKAQRLDKAAVSAEVATLRADRQAVQRDEPIIAAELDTLQPRIAALRGQRTAAQQRRAELLAAEEQDKRRADELLAAIGAKRKVVDRAAAEAETARDGVLFELGDKLYVDRPHKLAAQLAPIDAIDLELGEGDRRVMELREILSNVDKAKLARGILVIVAVGLVVGVIATYVALRAIGR